MSSRRQYEKAYFASGRVFEPVIKGASDWGDRRELLEIVDTGSAESWISLANSLIAELEQLSEGDPKGA